MIRPRASGGFRPRLDRHARRERGRILRLRAGQARPGALPHQVVRLDIDPEHNPFGLALDCYASAPQRIEPPPTPTQAGAPANASGHLRETPHEAHCLVGPGRRPADPSVSCRPARPWKSCAGAPALPVPLVVGQERVVFIDRNVRVGVPASVGDHLRVQSAGGAIYLRASEPIPPTRLQLQDVESGALILLDIAAEPAKDGQAPLEPVRIVGRKPREALRRRCSKRRDERGRCARRQIRSPARNAGTGRADAPCRTEPVRAAAHRRAGRRHRAREPAPRPRAGHLLPTLPVRARALAAWRLEDQWVTAVRLTNTAALARPRPARPAGELRGGDLPASEPGASRRPVRHHGALPGHARPRPGRVAAAGAEPDRRHREPAAGRRSRLGRRSAR